MAEYRATLIADDMVHGASGRWVADWLSCWQGGFESPRGQAGEREAWSGQICDEWDRGAAGLSQWIPAGAS